MQQLQVFFAYGLVSRCCLPTDLASSRLRLWGAAGHPQLPESLGLIQQHAAELSIPTSKPRGAVLLTGGAQTVTRPESRQGLNRRCRGLIGYWHQTHRVLFVNIDLRLQDGHGGVLLHSFTHTHSEVGPCEAGALMLQRTPENEQRNSSWLMSFKTADKNVEFLVREDPEKILCLYLSPSSMQLSLNICCYV